MTTADFNTKVKEVEKKINANKTKHSLIETEVKKINNFDASCFRGKNYFDSDGTQNYLVFQPMYKYFRITGKEISSWESKGLSIEKISYIDPPSAVNKAPSLVKFNRGSLKQDKVIYNHEPTVNIYVVCRLSPVINALGFTLENCLFGAVKLTGNADTDKYKYSEYGIGFDSRGSFTHLSGGYGKNVINFGADLSSSKHVDNKTRSILVLGQNFIQGKDGTTKYAEKMYSTNFTAANKRICLSLHYNGDNSYLFVNGKEIINFKAKDSEIVPHPLCLGNIAPSNPTGLTGYIYDISDDYWAIANDKILDIHKYLKKKII